MKFDKTEVRKCLKSFDFKTLFREHLGWDNHQAQLDIPVNGETFSLSAIAQKRGFVAFICDGPIPERATRLKIDHQITKSAREHFVVYADKTDGQQVWQWVRREQGKPLANRDHRFDIRQSGDFLIQRLDQIAVDMDEEETITVVDLAGRARAAFDVDKITKRFYDRFKSEHTAFLNLIKGFPRPQKITGKEDPHPDLQWYTSLMLNRLMFVYFIQKKGFLDGDTEYMRNRLRMVEQARGKDEFQSFYRYFLLRLFHDGLGRSTDERNLDPTMEKLLGAVPFLNGGFFEVHELEQRYPEVDIPDQAFEKLFDFFDQYRWHLDERPLRADNEINPDVVGYIFEKYINQKQMGAYYTKEDITEYISKNTVIPFLFDTAQNKCAIAFNPDSALWRLLRDNPDRYIYPAVRHGVVCEDGLVVPESELPDFVQKGMSDPQARMHDNRYNLQQAQADDPIRLVTETWREYVCRRNRCLDIREKMHRGEVHSINDLITLNLDIWQFARDAIVNAEGPELLRAFWHAIEKVTVLDPTCGSGAFLFAALRILETLYSDCLERMERFIEDIEGKPHHPEQYSDFKKVLAQIAKHPNERYFVLKSIIINNLFGVDIMEEAVEICKLRLFLKLVAQVDKVEQIEPLPDIDFNIRAGNTLVGYATADQACKAFTEERKSEIQIQGKLLIGETEDDYKRFQESAEMVEKAFHQFRAQQIVYGGKVTHKDKAELRTRLNNLVAELDRYLAGEYGINVKKQEEFESWQASHRPFHWFVEFYGIMSGGGFDVIIGNPPYVEYRKVMGTYCVKGYKTSDCGDLYAYVMERSNCLLGPYGTLGMIVPVSISGTDGFQSLRNLLLPIDRTSWCISFAERPSKLFTGVEKRLGIWLTNKIETAENLYTSKYYRWLSEERASLFATIRFTHKGGVRDLVGSSIPKIATTTERSILEKIGRQKRLDSFWAKSPKHNVYYTRKVRYFVQFFDFVPEIRDSNYNMIPPSELKVIDLSTSREKDLVIAILNSGLFFWFFNAYSDVRNVNRREIEAFPCSIDNFNQENSVKIQLAEKSLMKDFRSNAKMLTNNYGRHGMLTIQTFQPRLSKPIIDEIDRLLAQHYGFTDEELDFIINYDIKYRMGANGENRGE